MMKKLSLTAAAMVALGGITLSAQGVELVVNGDLETLYAADEVTPVTLDRGTTQLGHTTDNWGGGKEVFVPGWSDYTDALYNVVIMDANPDDRYPGQPDPGTVLTVNNQDNGAYQLLGDLAAGQYVLTVQVWQQDNENYNFAAPIVQLVVDGASSIWGGTGTVLTPDEVGANLLPGVGEYTEWMMTYNIAGGDPRIGDPLRIEFYNSSSSGQSEVDMVSVDYVPEPASASLLAAAGLMLLRRRR